MSKNVIKSFYLNEGEPFKIGDSFNKPEEEIEEEVSGGISYEEEGRKILEDAYFDKEQIIADANAVAEKIIQSAREEAESLKNNIIEDARKKGYDEGYNKGAKQAQLIIDESLRNQKSALNKYNELLDNAEADIVEIISYAAKKIIGDELSTRRDVILAIVSGMLSNIKKSTNVVIHVREEDYDILLENKQEILRKSGFIGEVEIRRDITVSECLIETPTGNTELNINLEIEKLSEILFETLRQIR